MPFAMKSWKKIYLYYGLIFFGVGLLGFSFSNQAGLSELIHLAFNDFSGKLLDTGLIRPRESREAAASNLQFPAIVLVSFVEDGEEEFMHLNQAILTKIVERFPEIIRYSAPNETWLHSGRAQSLLKNHPLLIGLSSRSSLIFSLPQSMSSIFFAKFIDYQPEFPPFRLELLCRESVALYRLSWLGSKHGKSDMLQLTEILFDVWEMTDFSNSVAVFN